MNKASWEKLRKELNKLPSQEKLLYLKEILKNVKEKELKQEILEEIQRTQEILDNEAPPEAPRVEISIPEPPSPRRRLEDSLEREIGEAPAPEREEGVNYGVSSNLENVNIYNQEKQSLYEDTQKYGTKKEESPLDMMREGERRAEEQYGVASRDSVLERESVTKRKREDEEMYR